MEVPLPDIEPCPKRKKLTVSFMDEQELDLLGWYRTNEIFYNQSLKEFKLKDKKDRLMLGQGQRHWYIFGESEDLADLHTDHLWKVGKANQVR